MKEISKMEKKDGLLTFFHETGEMSEEGYYKNGHKDGIHLMWYPNGILSSRANFTDGLLDGKYEGWKKDGSKFIECYHKEGIEVSYNKDRISTNIEKSQPSD